MMYQDEYDASLVRLDELFAAIAKDEIVASAAYAERQTTSVTDTARITRLETVYWDAKGRVAAAEAEAERIMELHEAIERGEVIIEERSTKRRQRQQEDELAFWDTWHTWNAGQGDYTSGNARIVTTGRRRTKVRGRFSPLDAEEAFFDATADTHGGKVRGGSKAPSGSYISSSGQRIRKR